MSLERYEMVVGLEVHVQVKTRTKAFCACSTQFGAWPNVNTCPVCLALPGTLPVLNAGGSARRARGPSLGSVEPDLGVPPKDYFYPTCQRGQISQFDRPRVRSLRIGENADGTPITIGSRDCISRRTRQVDPRRYFGEGHSI